MPYQLFNPEDPCTSLLPLNAVENKLQFYKVSVFEVSLESIATLNELPAAYARQASPYKSGETVRLGLPISMLFRDVRDKYQEVQVARPDRIPVLMSLEGTFLPFNPKRPAPDPIPEHRVAIQDVSNRRVQVGASTIQLDRLDARRLATQGMTFVKANGQTVRLRLDDSSAPRARQQSPIARAFAAMSRPFTSGGISAADLVGSGPEEVTDAQFEEIVMALLADPRSGVTGFAANEQMSRVIAQLPNNMYRGVFRQYKDDPRFVELLLRYRRGKGGAVHSRPKLPRFDIGLFTSIEQTWTLQGYSRGSLVNSLTLGPEEEMVIEVFTFDRRKVEEERTLTSEFERNTEVSSMTNITSNIARELSESNQLTGDLGIGVPLPAGGIPVDLSAGGSASMDVKSSIQAAMNQVSQATSRASERFKATRQVKVLESRETGREDRITRRIRNPNQGYTLTLNCYEVLETFRIETRVSDAKQFCLLVEFPGLGPVDVSFVLAYQDRLQQGLMSRTYLPGFEAARTLYAQGWFDTESIQRAELEQAANQSVAATAPAQPEKPIVTIAKQLAAALSKLFDADLMQAAEVLAEYYNPLDEIEVSDKDKAAAEATLGLVNYAFKLSFVTPGVEDRARTFIAAVDSDSSEAGVVSALGSFLAGADDEWVTNIKMLAASIVVANLAALLTIPFPILIPVLLTLAVIENSAGYPSLVGKAKQELKTYETAASIVPPSSDATSAADIKAKDPPPQLLSLQDLSMAHADFDALRLHIEGNRAYYMNQIWKCEDPNVRFERFRQGGIEAYVENRLLGFVGERGIFPLRLGALDVTVRATLEQKLTSFKVAEEDAVDVDGTPVVVGPISVASQQVSLPTSAVYMDGALGRCQILEPYLVARREIDRRIAEAEAELAEVRVADARARLDAQTSVSSPDSGRTLALPDEDEDG